MAQNATTPMHKNGIAMIKNRFMLSPIKVNN